MNMRKQESGDCFCGSPSFFFAGFPLSVVCGLNQSPSKNAVYRGRTRESWFEYVLIEVCLLAMPWKTFRSIFFYVSPFPLLLNFSILTLFLLHFCLAALVRLQLSGFVQPPALPHLLPHAPIGHPSQPHQGAALPEVEVDPHRHHPADDRSLHLSQYLLIFLISPSVLTPLFFITLTFFLSLSLSVTFIWPHHFW